MLRKETFLSVCVFVCRGWLNISQIVYIKSWGLLFVGVFQSQDIVCLQTCKVRIAYDKKRKKA